MIQYNNIFKDYLDNGIKERVDFPPDNKELVHYLPHHPVVRENKETTKVRVVFDASSKMKTQPSLNDVLHSGPCLLPFLQEILLRFRNGKIDLAADIKQAFLQSSISIEHRDLVRFLWYEDIYKENPKLVTLQFCRVVFGLTCSPLLLNGTISAHLEQFNGYVNLKEFICKFIRDLYVDDSSSSFDDIEDAYSFYKRGKSILNLAQFGLRKWETKDIKLKKQIQISESLDSSDTVPSVDDLQLTTRKV